MSKRHLSDRHDSLPDQKRRHVQNTQTNQQLRMQVARLTLEIQQLKQQLGRNHRVNRRYPIPQQDIINQTNNKNTNRQEGVAVIAHRLTTWIKSELKRCVWNLQQQQETDHSQDAQNTKRDIIEEQALTQLHSTLSDYLHFHDLLPPRYWQIKNTDQKRKPKTVSTSVAWTISIWRWHCRHKAEPFMDILHAMFDRFKTQIRKWFHWKSDQMSVQLSSQLQQKLCLPNRQMRVLQRLVRAATGQIVLANEKDIIKHQKTFELSSATTVKLPLAIVKTNKPSKEEMPEQEFTIYTCDPKEALAKTIDCVIEQNRFELPDVMNHGMLVLEWGFDKATPGTAESIAPCVSSQSHGKYGSIVTMFVSPKVADNYYNLNLLAEINNRREITNQMFKQPNVIILIKHCLDADTEQKSIQTSSYVMCFTPHAQKYWDERQQLPPQTDVNARNVQDTQGPQMPQDECMCLNCMCAKRVPKQRTCSMDMYLCMCRDSASGANRMGFGPEA